MRKILVLFAVSPLALAGCAAPAPDAPAPGEHVVLESASGDTGCIVGSAGTTFRRVFSDGTGALQPFQLPPDRSLHATDVDWQYRHPDGAAAAGRRITLRVFAQNLADPDRRERMLESTIVLNADGEGGTSEAMTTGFVVAPTAQICIDTLGGPKGPPFGVQHAILRGRFIPS